ncbi:uncharacterized protein B0H64DRAFT_445960 [Chaetomium fimeti]|uniref:Uncharacterized protein n=1 Tax=Chaetomium fimeti TaxID=1854472 RepID=A0AAE0H8J1_9PEZI|nr:hypothetical protein B0H64DRAFT_445960 [Chaetomium fimeti]
MPGPGVFLVDYFPWAGFLWRRGQGSPRILRSDRRDAVVQRALMEVNRARLRKRDAQRLIVGAVALVVEKTNDVEAGIRPSEGIIGYLERSADFSPVSRAIGTEVWAELIFQIAEARNKYERQTPQAQKDAGRDQLTALAFAIDDLLDAAGSRWDWMSLEFYVYPHLDDNEGKGKGKGEDLPRQMGGLNLRDARSEKEDGEDKDLPRPLEGLRPLDADGDVQMWT